MTEKEKIYRQSQNKIIIAQLVIPVLLGLLTIEIRFLYDNGSIDVTMVGILTIIILIVFVGSLIYSAIFARKLTCPYCDQKVNVLGNSKSKFFSFQRNCPHCNEELPKNNKRSS